jgi:hypothetical protein
MTGGAQKPMFTFTSAIVGGGNDNIDASSNVPKISFFILQSPLHFYFLVGFMKDFPFRFASLTGVGKGLW